MRKKIMLVFGTRPEAIKMAPVYNSLSYDDNFKVHLCVTAQHRELLDQVIELFDLPVDTDLNLMKMDQDIVDLMTNVMRGLKPVITSLNPDMLLVHGDTMTSVSAALVGFLMGVPVGHVEAGLRSDDLNSPFPEELNRRVTTITASLHFAPTESNRQNLLHNGVSDNRIFVTGNTVIDALQNVVKRIRYDSSHRNRLDQRLNLMLPNWPMKNHFILVTCHRRENFGHGIKNICEAVKKIAGSNPHTSVVFPVHPNSNVAGVVKGILGETKNIFLINPLPYELFCYVLMESRFLITDSGGLQEEAPFLNKPVLVTRSKTERKEALADGTIQLVGTDINLIVEKSNSLLTDIDAFNNMVNSSHPYGTGDASLKIKEALTNAIF